MEYRSVDSRIAIGRALAGLNGTMFTGPAGAPPYFSEWRALDKLGLTSEEISHRGLSRKVLEGLQPDLMIQRSKESGIYDNSRRSFRMLNRYMFDRGFVAIAAVHWSFDTYHHLFARRDSPLFDEMVSRLRNIKGAEYGNMERLMKVRGLPIQRDPEEH
jgi:hypothetical protein